MQIRIEGIKREELYTGSMLIQILESLQREFGEPFSDFFDRCKRYNDRMDMAIAAHKSGYYKAGHMLAKIAERYYS